MELAVECMFIAYLQAAHNKSVHLLKLFLLKLLSLSFFFNLICILSLGILKISIVTLELLHGIRVLVNYEGVRGRGQTNKYYVGTQKNQL